MDSLLLLITLHIEMSKLFSLSWISILPSKPQSSTKSNNTVNRPQLKSFPWHASMKVTISLFKSNRRSARQVPTFKKFLQMAIVIFLKGKHLLKRNIITVRVIHNTLSWKMIPHPSHEFSFSLFLFIFPFQCFLDLSLFLHILMKNFNLKYNLLFD